MTVADLIRELSELVERDASVADVLVRVEVASQDAESVVTG